ncbi:MAG: hypothetical protein GEU74_02565 [Nitriliruptorales bacterium]|nr:hypothetical protein [Nitriliruptorales bacterium]
MGRARAHMEGTGMSTPYGGDPNHETPTPADGGFSTSPPVGESGQVQPGYGMAPGAAPTGELAGFWIRFAGAFIDSVLLNIVAFILGLLVGAGTNGRSGLAFLLGAAYFTYFHGSSGQTVGQRAASIKVVDREAGGTIDYGRAFVRWLVSIVSGFILLLGFLWMLWDPMNQTWHDKAARTLVVKT